MTAAELAIILSVRDQATQTFKNVQSTLGATTRSLRTFADSAGSSLGPFLGGAGLGALGGALVGAGLRFDALRETSQAAFARMVGSAEVAKTALDAIDRASLKIPFAATAIREVGRQLVVAGTDLNDIPGFLTDIGDIASALPGNLSENVLSVGHAFAAMKTEGFVGASALETFTDHGIDAFKALGAQTDIQRLVMKRSLDAMPIPAEQMIARLRQGFRGMFGGLGQEQSETLTGVIQNLADVVNQRLGKALLPMFTRFKDLLNNVLDGIDQLVYWFKSLPKPVQDLVKEWGPWLLLLIPTVAAIAAVIGAVATVVGWITALAGVIAAIAGTVSGVLPVLALLAIAALTLYLAWSNNWLGIRDAVTTVVGNVTAMLGRFLAWLPRVWADPLGAMGDILKYAADGWLRIFGTSTDDVVATVSRAWIDVVDTFAWLAGQIAALTSDPLGRVVALWDASLTAVRDLVAPAWQYVVALAQWLGDTVLAILDYSLDGWAKVFGLRSTDIYNAVARAWQYVVSLTQWLSDTVGGLLATGWGYVAALFVWLGQSALTALQAPIGTIYSWFVWLWDRVSPYAQSIAVWVIDQFNLLADTVGGRVAGWARNVVDWFRWLVDSAKGLLGPLWNLITGAVHWTVNATGSSGVPSYATGGIVSSPTLAMVGEAGPEAIVPLSKLGGGGGGQPIQFVNYGVLAGHDVENWLTGVLDKLNRTGRTA